MAIVAMLILQEHSYLAAQKLFSRMVELEQQGLTLEP